VVIFLYGPDTYSSRQKLNQIIEKYKAKHKTGLNLNYLDMEEVDLTALKEIIETRPMFKEKKLVILENVFGKNSQWQKELIDYLKEKDIKNEQEIILVFYEKESCLAGSGKGELFKFLTKKPVLYQEFKNLEGIKLENWIKKEVTKYGKEIEEKAIKKLVAEVGSDLWQMANEVNKLISYKDDKVIKEKDVEILVKPKIDTNIFATIDAIAYRDKKKALKLLHQHLEKKDDEIYLLTMFIYQFRNLLKLKDLVEKGVPFYQLAKRTGLHPFVVKKSWEQIKKFSLKELKKIYQKLLFLDLEIKIGQIEP